ncbi:MAG: membrane dipeptidase [Ginsengibacter sp.]
MQTRGKFIKNSLALTGGYLFLQSFNNKIAAQNINSYFTFDLHSHPGRLFATPESGLGEVGSTRTISEMRNAHLNGAFFSLVADATLIKVGASGLSVARRFTQGEAWKEYRRQMKNMKDYLNNASVHIGKRKTDLHNNHTLTAYLAVEGGDFLEDDSNKVYEAFQNGIRSIQLVHYAPNNIGDLQTLAPTNNGLTAFGKEVIRKMNKVGMLIDLAHANYQTVKDVVSITDSPVMLSHSILEMESDRPMAKRAISKEHAKLISQTGGIVGAWPSAFNKNFDEYVDNTLHLVEVLGIDHVGIGTDMDANFRPVLTSYEQFPTFAQALKTKGFSQSEVEKIMGGNARRVCNKVFKS